MTRELVRFGIAFEADLLEELDAVAARRACTRSELLRDLARAEVAKQAQVEPVPAVAAVTLVYNHHVRLLSERLTTIQHEMGESVRSTMHVHLDHDHCIEVVVLRGRADTLQDAADRMLATRGVTHGGVEIVSEHALAQAHDHRHGHEHGHAHAPARKRAAKKPARKRS